ncbi:MAG: HAD hydrolase family protein [Eubacterium sp.]|nr:HAD hydrolase family protein [Eubacterium sp.]
MSYDIKMIALDLDNTTLRKDKSLSDRTRNALVEAMKRGVYVVVASGRVFSSLPENVMGMPGLKYVINSNGACITELPDDGPRFMYDTASDVTGLRNMRKLDPAYGTRIYNHFLPEETVRKITDVLAGNGVLPEVLAGGYVYMDEAMYRDIEMNGSSFRHIDYTLWSRRPAHDIYAIIDENISCIETINMSIEDNELREKVKAELKQIEGVTVTNSVWFNIEVEAEGTSKGSALAFLLDQLGLDPSQLMACGDSPNDGDMIKLAGLGVAVANAEPVILELADYVTDSSMEDGVAKAVEKFVL